MVKVSKKMSWEVIKGILLPLVVFLLFLSGYLFYRIKIISMISSQFEVDFRKYIASGFVVGVAFIIQRAVGAILLWYRENVAVKTVTRLDDELVPLVRRTSNVFIWIVAFLVILPFFGVNISALVAALGVSSLAIALAAQDTIANIIAGFMIMIDRPFRIGDEIKLSSGDVVKVLDIGVRRSKFISQDEAIVIIPNLELSKSKIVNYSYGKERTESLKYSKR